MRLGYRSDIRILTTKKGFDVLKKYVDLHTNRDRDINLFDGLHVKEEGKTNIYFGWDFLKWYPGYESVDNVMNGLNYLKELDLSYHYKRFGENYDDIEVLYYDSPSDELDKNDSVNYVDTDSCVYEEVEEGDEIGL